MLCVTQDPDAFAAMMNGQLDDECIQPIRDAFRAQMWKVRAELAEGNIARLAQLLEKTG